jgi:hypothetical protein
MPWQEAARGAVISFGARFGMANGLRTDLLDPRGGCQHAVLVQARQVTVLRRRPPAAPTRERLEAPSAAEGQLSSTSRANSGCETDGLGSSLKLSNLYSEQVAVFRLVCLNQLFVSPRLGELGFGI